MGWQVDATSHDMIAAHAVGWSRGRAEGPRVTPCSSTRRVQLPHSRRSLPGLLASLMTAMYCYNDRSILLLDELFMAPDQYKVARGRYLAHLAYCTCPVLQDVTSPSLAVEVRSHPPAFQIL